MKISGTNVVMAARQAGKSIAGTQVNQVWIDEWDEVPIKKVQPAPPVYLSYNTPPLAIVIAMLEAGKQSYEIYNTLQGLGKNPHIKADTAISTEHQAQAAEIYDYFAKKHTMRRIKDEWISEYMLAVDELCENRKRVNEEHIKILVSLPRIYKQNRAVERVMKGSKSTKKIDNISFAAFKGEVEFVEKVHYKAGRSNELHYYFSTPKNYLLRIVVKKGDYGETAWNTLSQAGKLYIDSPAIYTYNIKGYDFNVLQPTPQAEITIV